MMAVLTKSKFCEQQIVGALNPTGSEVPVMDVCRAMGASPATRYLWRSKNGGLDASGLKRINEIGEEIRQPKPMHAGLSPDHKILKDIVERKR